MTIQWCNVISKCGRFDCSLTSYYAFCGTFCVGFFLVIYITMVASSAEESHLTHSKLSRTQQYIYCRGFSKLWELRTNKPEKINMTSNNMCIFCLLHSRHIIILRWQCIWKKKKLNLLMIFQIECTSLPIGRKTLFILFTYFSIL